MSYPSSGVDPTPQPPTPATAESVLTEVERRLRRTQGYAAQDNVDHALLHIDAYRAGTSVQVGHDNPTPNTKEQNIAFRKQWDAHIDETKGK